MDNYVDTKNVTKTTADKKAVSTGIGFKYDILGSDSNYTVKNNRGTMYFDAQLANTIVYLTHGEFGLESHPKKQMKTLLHSLNIIINYVVMEPNHLVQNWIDFVIFYT